jgi:hypothetical protein
MGDEHSKVRESSFFCVWHRKVVKLGLYYVYHGHHWFQVARRAAILMHRSNARQLTASLGSGDSATTTAETYGAPAPGPVCLSARSVASASGNSLSNGDSEVLQVPAQSESESAYEDSRTARLSSSSRDATVQVVAGTGSSQAASPRASRAQAAPSHAQVSRDSPQVGFMCGTLTALGQQLPAVFDMLARPALSLQTPKLKLMNLNKLRLTPRVPSTSLAQVAVSSSCLTCGYLCAGPSSSPGTRPTFPSGIEEASIIAQVWHPAASSRDDD